MHSNVFTLDDWRREGATGPAVVDCRAVDASAVRPGTIDAACGRAAFTYIETAIDAARAGHVAAIATAPIHKEAFHQGGVPFPGHTELFAARTGTPRFCMLLASDELAVGFVTMHNSVAEISGKLSVERVLEVIELTAEAVHRLRGRLPRVTVCGLNPHAGEHGLFGLEETEFIMPAILRAADQGLEVGGPEPPDTAFLPEVRARTDAYVAMYHDQGHIPFKMLSFETGVNITLGLPIVRTSVDHGTAFDIAWQGIAKPTSLIQAINYAVRLAPS
jgi:4-hydroxythreonine-4-phosphate dehydrogenase